MRLTLWTFLKWVSLFFLVVESLGLAGSLLNLGLKLAHPNAALGHPTWGDAALELTLRFALVGLVLSAYFYLRDVSRLPPIATRESVLLTTRAVQSGCLAAVALYALVGEKPARLADQGLLLSAWSLFAAALGTVITGLFLRRRILHLANERLRRDPHDPEALSQWRRVTIMSLVLAMSIALYGFALRMSGKARIVESAFFLASVGLLFLWRPHLADVPSSSSNPFSPTQNVESR